METSAQLAGRAIGAGFFTVFGAAWLMSWAVPAFGVAPAAIVIGLAALCLLTLCVRQYRLHRGALAGMPDTPQRRRASRIFLVTNVAQWGGLVIAANVLSWLGLGAWMVPVTMLIVGLHMFPLASAYRYRPHYVTGAALILVALVCPLLSSDGPAGLASCLYAGLILWLSACWALSQPLRSVKLSLGS
jgi:hypothetical protein